MTRQKKSSRKEALDERACTLQMVTPVYGSAVTLAHRNFSFPNEVTVRQNCAEASEGFSMNGATLGVYAKARSHYCREQF